MISDTPYEIGVPSLIFLDISSFFLRKSNGKVLQFHLWDLASEVFSKIEDRGFMTLEKKNKNKKNPERSIIYVELSTYGAGGTSF